MEPQLLIASLYEHGPTRALSGQHDLAEEATPLALDGVRAGGQAGDEGAASLASSFDVIGVIIALLAMIGIMIAVAMMGSEGAAPSFDAHAPLQRHLPHLMWGR